MGANHSESRAQYSAQSVAALYHTERNHQGLGNKIIAPDRDVGRLEGEVVCRKRLGGLLKYYHRAAA